MPAGKAVVVARKDDAWWVNNVRVGAGDMTLEPAVAGDLLLNGKPYRGNYRFVSTGVGTFDVVNDVDVESYLYSVLPKELFPNWHVQAYKAQAVIARTYALYEVRTVQAGRHWDLHPDERSQVYGGMIAETPKSTSAVEQTRGVVCVYGPSGQEKIFKAYFSSCCGGVSNSSADVFNEPAIAPLDARNNGTQCAISTRFNWGPMTFTKAELTRRVRAWGIKQNRSEANINAIKSIVIATANTFGRPSRYTINDTRGASYTLTAEQLRWAINTDPQGGLTVFSGFFTPVNNADTIQLTDAHGFGHGVGACQWCMQALALSGTQYEQIVLKNYPQSSLARAY